MKGSVIRRMYAGFALIIFMFAATTLLTMRGMQKIHTDFDNVANAALPLVSQANLTSVTLLSTDKLFKDYLTTQSFERMDEISHQFNLAQEQYENALAELDQAASLNQSGLESSMALLNTQKDRYFAQAKEAMSNYRAMFEAQAQVQKSSRRFQRLHSELSAGMKEYIDEQSSISLKIMAKSYFIKLKDAEVITSDALASSDTELVAKAVAKNKKAVTHLNYAYRGLAAQLPEIKNAFDESVEQFSTDIGKKGGVLDQHNSYLVAKSALYSNVESLTSEVDQIMATLNTFSDAAQSELHDSLFDAAKVYDQGVIGSITVGSIAIILALGISYHIAQSVRKPLSRILATLEHLTNGDMTQRIDIRYNNEFSRVSEHINTLTDSLHDILVKISDASDDLTTTANTNQTTSSQAQIQLNQQRQQTANVATAMTEMSQSVQEVAQNAQDSQRMIESVESASESGRKVMLSNINTITQLESRLTQSVSTVSELQALSSQIGTILDVIRNIAEQTNLLALNAAIEAARAGEQGRGFSVVADEVRVLAQRTTDSTTEIETMITSLQSSSTSASKEIQSCMTDMTESVEQASSANHAMQEIQSLVTEFSRMSSQISQAAAEQSTTSSDIARNIEEINLIAEQNYQAMAQIARTSTNLTTMANQQGELVHKFKL